jgi:5-methylcytosine-specific restriction endonuclease McrA
MNWAKTIGEIEDVLFAALRLDPYERTAYYHLLRHTRCVDKDAGAFGLVALGAAIGVSSSKVRRAVRSMDRKGCLRIEQRGRLGHLIRVVLPCELPSLQPAKAEDPVDIEALDFFRARRYLIPLLSREGRRCFYCFRKVRPDSCALDHVNPQVNGLDNSYRNVVVACYECNSRKQGRNGEDFVRLLYRNGVLSASECQDRVEAIERLRSGKLVPKF